MEYIKIEAVLNDFLNSTGQDFVDEDTYFQWTSDCLDQLGCQGIYEPSIALLTVKNFTAKLPEDWVSTDLLYFYKGTAEKLDHNIKEITHSLTNSSCKIVCENCEVSPIVTDASAELINSMPWLGYHRVSEISTINNQYASSFTPMQRKEVTHQKFFLENCIKYPANPLHYSVLNNSIQTTFKEGQILLLYFAKKVDSRGYPMIPNITEVIQAIIFYIDYKIAYAEYRTEKDNKSRTFFTDVTLLYNSAASKARAALNPITWDMAESLKNIITEIVPNYNQRYAKFTQR